MTDIQRLVDAVQSARADIAPTYQEYVQLAFALATECGEAGRSYFHDLCRFSPKYDAKNADKVYGSALASNRGDVKIATAYHLAKQAGVTINHEGRATSNEALPTAQLQNCTTALQPHTHARGEEALPGSEPSSPLPLFPAADWPEPLPAIMKQAQTPQQRDVLLLGALTVLGATLERRVRCYYGGKPQSPCLQTFIVAPPASGKGVLSLLRWLVMPLHNEMRARYEQQLAIYRKEKAAYDALGKERAEKEPPEKPVNRMFLIPGNNSGTGILQNLMDGDGTGLILETEADTLSSAICADYGHFSDLLRKVFDHEMLAYNRRTNEEYREVEHSYLSVLLSGTPAQVKPLIPSSENGLFSRQLFYYMPGLGEWLDQFDADDTNLEALFAALGKEWKRRLDALREGGIYTLRLTTEQRGDFYHRFNRLFFRARLTSGYEMSSSVARLAINICRILSVVAMLRGDFTPDKEIPADNLKDGIIQRWDVRVHPSDFEAVMALVEPLYRHTLHILSFLPSTEVTRRNDSECDDFFARLSEPFTRAQVKELAARQRVKEKTALSWLYRLEKRGILVRSGGDNFSRACV